MHLGGAGIKDHVLDLAACGAAHDRIVYQNDAFALDQSAVHIELEAYAHVADLLGRFDEGPAHILVADDPHGIGNARLLGIADGGGGAAIGHRADEICLHRAFLGQFHANLAAGFIDRTATKDGIGAAEIDMFEDAEAGFLTLERVEAFQAFRVNHHHFARFNLADEFGADDIQRTGFRRQRPAITQTPQNQRAHAQGIAHADQLGAGHGDDRERAFDPAQRVFHPFGDVLLDGAGHQMDDAFAV